MSDLPENVYQFTKPATAIWLSVVTPKSRTQFKAEPRFEATFLLDAEHPDLGPVKALLGKIAKQKFGGVQGLKFPLQDGSKMADEAQAKNKDREFLRGKVVLSAHSNTKAGDGKDLFPPRLWVLVNDQYVEYRDAERGLATPFFYNGVSAVPTLAFAPFDTMGKGVTAYLNRVLSINVGEKIAGGADGEQLYGDTFRHYAGRQSAVNPTAGMDDEIPF